MTYKMLSRTCLSIALAMGTLQFAYAEESDSPIIRVEEDWVLQLSEPDSDTGSPQLATQMKPVESAETVYAIFCLNYQEVPDFIEGGMELQLWNQEWVVDVDGKGGYRMALDGETVSWTQYLKLDNGRLYFGVKDGTSQTYGSFGGESLRVSQTSSLTNLSLYKPERSVADSAVTLGSNRVRKMYLKEVRYIKADETVVKDTNVRSVIEEVTVE